jgi:ubiquinone/menaquinone biosynthesis C-methylase UbiE
VTLPDPEEQRAASRESWETAAVGWGRRAERVREWGMPVSEAMIDALQLRSGDRVLELAAGPGDTGLIAAKLVRPAAVISSDGAVAMLEVARQRARAQGIDNVEFRQLELEWIDLPTASIDAVLCRWGIMLTVDPEAAAREVRRVLVPGGRAAMAVWGDPARNPWATVPSGVMVDLGYAQPPDPQAPGMFALAGEGRLSELLYDSGFTDVSVAVVALERRYLNVDEFVAETFELSPVFSSVHSRLSAEEQADVAARIAIAVQPFTAADGSLSLPGSSLVARAIA